MGLLRGRILRADGTVVADQSFDAGVRRGAESGLLGSLFSVRALDLLEGTPYAQRLCSAEEIISALRGRKTAEAMGVNFLGEIPLDPAVRAGLAPFYDIVPVSGLYLDGIPDVQRQSQHANDRASRIIEGLQPGLKYLPLPLHLKRYLLP